MQIINNISEIINDKITQTTAVGGGCIAESFRVKTASGRQYFLKTVRNNSNMFRAEADGLCELAKPACIGVPGVIAVGDDFLLMEYIERGRASSDFYFKAGEQLARMHRHTNPEFGFVRDNYIGSGRQFNIATGTEKTDWAEFYFNKRLLPQYNLAVQNAYDNSEFKSLFLTLESHLPKILEGSENTASLLHGDLWSGNMMCNGDGNPVIFDPAVYYGNRETDIAMTLLFGGFPEEFYAGYDSHYPLADGWRNRMPVYQLYHILNHLNLFGKSYYNEAITILRRYNTR